MFSHHVFKMRGILAFVVLLGLGCSKGRNLRTGNTDNTQVDAQMDVPTDARSGDDLRTDLAGPSGTDVMQPSPVDNGAPDGSVVIGTAASIDDGQPCIGGGDCKSGFCVDSVCCNLACTGKCQGCAEAYTGAANGVCGPVRVGTDPHDSCADSAAELCGDDGTCDGNGACRKFGSNQVCAQASCSGAMFTKVRTCDGSGTCGPQAAVNCGAYPCTTMGCAQPCVADAECGASNYCVGGVCKSKKANGDVCAAKNECSSGFCVDGACCQTECTGICLSCAETETGQKSGSCQPVVSGKTSGTDCPVDVAATCGRDGTCDGKGGCRKYDSATKCADAVCATTMFTPARTCANGICGAATNVDCKQAICTPAGCQNGCTKDTDCVAGAYCAGTSCVARKSNGENCTIGNECTSKACIDGVCCDTACTGTCYACVMAKTGQASGKCAPVSAGTDLDNECAATAQATCGTEGTCDGAGACRRWPKGTACAAGMCNTTGNFVPARTCDGLGTCDAATTEVCAPNICAATGCVRTCTTDAQCTGNNYCATGGHCTARKTPGMTCGAANECQSGFCVDGVCCNNACNGVCVSCRAVDTGQQADGTCANITSGKDPANECAVSSPPCGPDGWCGGGRCRFAPATVSCADPSCTNGANNTSATLRQAKTCDGNGSCPTTNSQAPCPGNVLCASPTGCKSATCGSDLDCISGFYCASGACKAKVVTGQRCTGSSSGNQCVSNNCSSDGICCGSSCTATCQGCDTANTGVATGTCGPRIGPNACNGACAPGYSVCGTTSCIKPTWNFDQGPPANPSQPYGWVDGGSGAMSVLYVAGVSHTANADRGTLALSFDSSIGGIATTTLCAAGMDLRGKSLTFWVMRSKPSELFDCGFSIDDGFSNRNTITSAPGVWQRMLLPLDPGPTSGAVRKIGISCQAPSFDPITGLPWDGVLYLDDVTITP